MHSAFNRNKAGELPAHPILAPRRLRAMNPKHLTSAINFAQINSLPLENYLAEQNQLQKANVEFNKTVFRKADIRKRRISNMMGRFFPHALCNIQR
jgi:hypothetical protein